jgi:hypothetical protein
MQGDPFAGIRGRRVDPRFFRLVDPWWTRVGGLGWPMLGCLASGMLVMRMVRSALGTVVKLSKLGAQSSGIRPGV